MARSADRRAQPKRPRLGGWAALALTPMLGAVAAPSGAQDFSIVFGQGSGESRIIRFDESDGSETWFLTRCQSEVSPDYYVMVREFGEAEPIKPVSTALEAEKTVCVIGHIPDFVKRYMR